MNKITINGKDYKFKYTIRALFIFEKIAEKPFEVKTILDNYILFYSMLLANNPDDIMEWNDFINAMDEDPSLLENLNEILSKNAMKDELLGDNTEGGENPSQKKN